MIALIDGDILVYECGFSSDANAKKDGRFEGHEPLEYTLKIVKNKIAEIIDTTKADSYEIYLTGKENFRNAILPEYKANRDPSHKPHWYKEITEYLVHVQKAVVVDGMEADDIMGIRQCNEPDDWTCIASKDKDLDCIPGFHYNWSPSKQDLGVYDMSEVDSLRFFYTQILTGDATDNIPGLKKLTGQIATKKKKEPLQEMEKELDMYNYVKELYGDTNFIPIAQCLWILRKEGVIWHPPITN